MTEGSKRYKVADIAVDDDGVLWLHYVGEHPDQGGMSYRWGSVGVYTPKDLGAMVARVFKRELPEYNKQIAKKKSTPEGS